MTGAPDAAPFEPQFGRAVEDLSQVLVEVRQEDGGSASGGLARARDSMACACGCGGLVNVSQVRQSRALQRLDAAQAVLGT